MLWSVEWDHVIHCNFIFVPKALATSMFNFFAGGYEVVNIIHERLKPSVLASSLKIIRIFMVFALIISFLAMTSSLPWERLIYDDCPFLPKALLISTFSFITANLDFVRSFMLVAAFSSFMAILCSVELEYLETHLEDVFPEGPVAAIWNFISGICVLIAVELFDTSVSEAVGPVLQNLADKWAFFLSYAVCVLCFITGFRHSEEGYLTFRYKFFARIFSCMGLVFLFVTLVSPFWIVIISKDYTVNLGLWNMCKATSCKKITLDSRILIITRILMSFSTVNGLVAAACTFLSSSTFKVSKWPIITNFWTGITSLLTMLLYGLSLRPNSPFDSPVPSTTAPKYVSWAFVMGCIACFLFLLTANVQGARTLLVMALFCGIVGASFMTFSYRYSSSFTIYRYLVAAMGSLIAAALVFLALSIYTIRISTHIISRTGKVKYLWTFYVAWTSCPFFILSGLFSLMAHQRLLMHGSSLTDGDSTITSSSSEWTTESSSYLENEDVEKKVSGQYNLKLHRPSLA
ncbi:uncharacterized protein LOC133370856 [Rhineura floridana]|uniref:uncharacterized protein LOC133370856 n=1 Tax=Rhineura floridana TaxID=261503 RepID=UPI002AC8564F|nr:uncharacterized protein LOC133370856 [Rhineura floridana]